MKFRLVPYDGHSPATVISTIHDDRWRKDTYVPCTRAGNGSGRGQANLAQVQIRPAAAQPDTNQAEEACQASPTMPK
ncbi:hypothetical protein AMTR_s00030p00115400 [Amborella trichopoda]|uniref:Uncharacterized protein n=1 Tax=Amborella trichopoda TaxID=13333 RepID=U5D3S7_AMBTC|nr:hypothetical protein AMTR_s00030p00115400 [Amborella trichopoda]